MIVLDNYKLLDCYYQTNYLTQYLDNLSNYELYNQEIYLPKGTYTKSRISNKGIGLLLTFPNNHLLAAGCVYLLFHLDRHKPFNNYILSCLRINNIKYKAMLRTIRIHNLKAILRPSKPFRGLRHKRGYTGFDTGL